MKLACARNLSLDKLLFHILIAFVRQDQLEKLVRECIEPLSELARELVETKPTSYCKQDVLGRIEPPSGWVAHIIWLPHLRGGPARRRSSLCLAGDLRC